jgi:hypothetical protein
MNRRLTWRVIGRLALAVVLLGLFPALSPQPAHAASGLTTFMWYQSYVTASASTNTYSNVTGMVQALDNSNGCPVTVDGIYGSLTTWYTAELQNDIIGWNNGGVMSPNMWYELDIATSVYGDRKSYQHIVDGYGTEYWSYYGGIDPSAELGWNPWGTQWLYAPYPVSNRAYLVPATISRTPMSVSPCA